MAAAFDLSVGDLEAELASLIGRNMIKARIDAHNKARIICMRLRCVCSRGLCTHTTHVRSQLDNVILTNIYASLPFLISHHLIYCTCLLGPSQVLVASRPNPRMEALSKVKLAGDHMVRTMQTAVLRSSLISNGVCFKCVDSAPMRESAVKPSVMP